MCSRKRTRSGPVVSRTCVQETSLGERKIIHVDMDAFYASVEQRDRPELRGRPLVVGGRPDGRGVVAAASYEARRFGVHSAMPCARAARLCPDMVFVSPDFGKYTAVSNEIREIFRSVTDLVEPLSLDEAYLDVSVNRLGEPLAGRLARHLKQRILQETGLIASAGVGPNKLIAKLASDHDKPDGLVIVPPARVDAFLVPLPVKKLWGVGPKTAQRLETLGIRIVADLRRSSPAALMRHFGKYGGALFELAHGRDERAVSPEREAKSRGAETTFARDLDSVVEVESWIDQLAIRVAADVRRGGKPGRTVVLKLRYADFTTITRSRTLRQPTDQAARIAEVAKDALRDTEVGTRRVRLVGVQVSGFVDDDEPAQLELDFAAAEPETPES